MTATIWNPSFNVTVAVNQKQGFTPVTAGQTVVVVPFTYTVGNNSLQVFINGLKQASGYVETNSTTVTFDEPLPDGVVEFVAVTATT